MEISIIWIERGHIEILQYDEWNVVCDMWYAVVYITQQIWNVTDIDTDILVINAFYLCAACDDANCIHCTERAICTSCGFGYFVNHSYGCNGKSKEYCTKNVIANVVN